MYDITLLTDPRYLSSSAGNGYIDNVILEDKYVMDACTSEGLKVNRVAWDDPDFDWSTTKFALFRAVWDYFDRIEEFQNWYKNTSKLTKFINPKSLIDWNIDKHYLKELHQKGIPISKTLFVESGEKTSLLQAFQKLKYQGVNGDDFVLKPCIAAGARHTYKIHISEADDYNPIFQRLILKEAMIVQEFQNNVVKHGELSLMLFNGEFTHSVLKMAKPGDFRVQDDFGGSVQHYQATEEEIEFAQKVIHATPQLPLYARVDMFRNNNDQLALAELEIFEPELWFRLHPQAAELMAYQLRKTYFE